MGNLTSNNDSSIQRQWRLFTDKFSLLEFSGKDSPKRMLAAKNTRIHELHTQLVKRKDNLQKTTIKRSRHNPMGSFYTLAECEKLRGKDSIDSFDLKGRYAETGKDLYQFACDLLCAGQQLEDTKNVLDERSRNSDGTEIDMWIGAQNRLAITCDHIISFMITAPFEVKTHESTIHEAWTAVKILQNYLSGDKLATHECLNQQVDMIDEFLGKRLEDYKKRAELFKKEKEDRQVPPGERPFAHLDIRTGDLAHTKMVVECMSRDRNRKGLGLPIVCTGPPKTTGISFRGGYGAVYKMTLPDNACNLDRIKILNRPVSFRRAQKCAIHISIP
ncbi:hypothetical protein SCHPADRAFT_344353 [Schizopora paradoxa]|uniref:Uncharacterized protein n=1 Tax=Schizopora paradoxa TaxID=27342 RepID=A0A0H2RPP2_9AGAM|nr:hypothetical protein SCHPADRAFT_344353 [Schizopora paradoxa]